MNLLKRGPAILRTYGLLWLGYRLRHAWADRLGRLRRRMPMLPWAAVPAAFLDPRPPLLPAPLQSRVARFATAHPEAATRLIGEADAILAGQFRRFEGPPEPFGFPPPWTRETEGVEHPAAGTHWSLIRPAEDIKLVWELSRFRWAHVLGRAWRVSGSPKYAEGFWALLEDWRRRNPPNQGPNWMCGQEAAIRIQALALAEGLLEEAEASTPDRRRSLRDTVYQLARRIEPHLAYARSQRNNHSLNEALGLVTAGLMLPEAPESAAWVQAGWQVFQADLKEQLDQEGSYIQHSITYHRVMLQACTWMLRLGARQGLGLDPDLRQRLGAGLAWLQAMVDPATGQAPNLGSNDGANNLPLSSCDYLDMRPALQATAALLGQPLPFLPGAWDEPLLWLTDLDPVAADRVLRTDMSLHAPGRGHFVRTTPGGRIYLHAVPYRDRPSQADLLHLDLTWRGLNLLCDAGTWRYSAPAPWANALASAPVHNTITLQGRSPMARVGPFLWLDWEQGRILSAPEDSILRAERLPGRHYPLRHRRTILPCGPEHWLILDEAQGPGLLELHWLMPELPGTVGPGLVRLDTREGPFEVRLLGPGTTTFQRGQLDGPAPPSPQAPLRGWRSLHYNQVEPALSLVQTAPGRSPILWLTAAGAGPFDLQVQDGHAILTAGSTQWSHPLPAPLSRRP